MTYNIVCDSSCDLKSTELQPGYLHLEVFPMQITVGDREYLDNESLNVPLLLEEMATEKSSAGSTQPIIWWGTPAISSAVGLAVPTSMTR